MNYKNKVITCLGDSITNKNHTASINYVDLITKNMGFTANNLAISGAGYMRWQEKGISFGAQADKIPLDTDVVTILGSFNDLSNIEDLGSWDDEFDAGNISIGGCINKAIDTIQTRLPAASLGIIAPYPWSITDPKKVSSDGVKYVELLKLICFKRGIPFLNLFRCSNLRPWVEENNELFFYDSDGTHLNNLGHEFIFPQIREFIKTLI